METSIFKVAILKGTEIILVIDKLTGTQEKVSILGQSFFNIISSLEPEKYKDAKPVLIPVN